MRRVIVCLINPLRVGVWNTHSILTISVTPELIEQMKILILCLTILCFLLFNFIGAKNESEEQMKFHPRLRRQYFKPSIDGSFFVKPERNSLRKKGPKNAQ